MAWLVFSICVGPIPYDVNVITDYNFIDKINTTPGTFDFDLADYNLDTTAATTGNGNLDEYATFRTDRKSVV